MLCKVATAAATSGTAGCSRHWRRWRKPSPACLSRLITDHEDGTYTVRLYGEERQVPSRPRTFECRAPWAKTADGQDAMPSAKIRARAVRGSHRKGICRLEGWLRRTSCRSSIRRAHRAHRPGSHRLYQGAVEEALGETFRGARDEGRAIVVRHVRPDLSLERGGIIPGHAATIMQVEGTGENARRRNARPTPMASTSPTVMARDGVFQLSMQEFRSQFDYFSSSSEKDDGNNKLW